MNIAIRKTDWGIAPVGRQTMDFIKNLEPGKTFVAKLIEDERSLNQNRTLFMWLTEISEQSPRGLTKEELHIECKKRYVIPILCREDEDWATVITNVQRSLSPPSEEYDLWVDKCIHTSGLSVPLFAEMLTELQHHAITRGIRLTDPEELRWAA